MFMDVSRGIWGAAVAIGYIDRYLSCSPLSMPRFSHPPQHQPPPTRTTDLVFIMLDRPDDDHDQRLSRHIVTRAAQSKGGGGKGKAGMYGYGMVSLVSRCVCGLLLGLISGCSPHLLPHLI